MPKSSNQKLKLLYLKEIFETYTDEKHMINIKQIIDLLAEYGVKAERKSVYDDIECLKQFGLDIITVKSDSNYYYLCSRNFELPELKLLVDSVQSSKFLTVKKSASLIKKLESLCSNYEGAALQRQVFIANRIKNMNESIYLTIDKIHNAILSKSKISFKYVRYSISDKQVLKKDGAVYKISPYALMLEEQNYYLLGFDSESKIFKHFRVDKIIEINIIDEKSDGEDEFRKIDLGKYNKKFFSMFGGKEENVKLQIASDLLGVIIDRFGKNIIIMKTDDNHFETCVNIAVSPQFYGWIASFSGKIKIVSPENVVEDFLKHLEKVKNSYK